MNQAGAMKAKRRKRARRPKSLVQELTERATSFVLLDSTRVAIEKMAEEFVRDMMRKPKYRADLHRAATRAAERLSKTLQLEAAAAAEEGLDPQSSVER